MEFAHVSRLYLMNWLVYIHCYSQTHCVSSLICSLSRASRKFYTLISLIHLCKDRCFVLWTGGLLLMPPDLQDVTDMMTPACFSHQSMCLPCLPEKAPAASSVALVTMGTGLALVMWSEEQVCFSATVAAAVPKATDRQPKAGLVHGLYTLLLFFSFPGLNFQYPCTSLSPPQSPPS